MPSVLETMLGTAGYSQLWATLARPLPYFVKATGQTLTVNAIFRNNPSDVRPSEDGQFNIFVGHLEVRLTGPDATPVPARGDYLIDGDDTVVDGQHINLWTVDYLLNSTPYWAKAQVSRVSAIGLHSPKYLIERR